METTQSTATLTSQRGAGSGPYAGMKKEDLEFYSQTPFWKAIRWSLYIIFWAVFFGLLATSITMVALSEDCSVSTSKWWQNSIIYQIYPRSFQDTNGDGNGDLKGISSRVEYLDRLGVGAVWLNPIYKSPLADNGYDVEDYREIDEMYGTMEDLDNLIRELHDKDMKIIMDFIPNHTSDKHRWFEASRANNSEDNVYRDYYVWKDGDPGTPPNNWVSVFGGRAWTYDSTRAQWYLHQFLKEQPDLNIRNTKVQQELEDVLKFWMDKDIDGFRMDAIKYLFEAESFADEEASGLTTNPDDYDYLSHDVTVDQQETYDLVQKWADLVTSYSSKEREIAIITEVYNENITKIMKYFDYGSNIPFNFELVDKVNSGCTDKTKCIYDAVMSWMNNMPEGRSPNWQVGNHDNKRTSSRLGAQYVNNINIMLLLLPGTPTVYYGEEIGMRDNEEYYQPETVFNRRYCRTPMQWDNITNAGFTNISQPWLAVNVDYVDRNVFYQESNAESTLTLFKNLTMLRKEISFSDVESEIKFSNDSINILAFTTKSSNDADGYLVILNFGNEVGIYDPSFLGVTSGVVVLTSPNSERFKLGDNINLTPPKSFLPGDGVVIRY